MKGCVVVKVGGSLYDLSDLRLQLVPYLKALPEAHIVLVPGGGPTADAVRTFDRVHSLGEKIAHDLALRSLTLNAHFLARLVSPNWPIIHPLRDGVPTGISVVDAHAFCDTDAGPGSLPASWDATSDSLAARVAVVLRAHRLVLLKSITWEGQSLNEAMAQGVVDPLFVRTLSRGRQQRPRSAPEVVLVNFRE